MARFILQALPATFIHCDGGPSGSYDMVNVAMRAAPLARQTVDVRNIGELAERFAAVKATLMAAGLPFSLRAILDHGERAPRGWNDAKAQFRVDEPFGIYENA